ncbi:hypothetical protein O3S80_37535, partial [Streptomyces sp. Lzd4kr]|nr:hypothetical protein [Streptomyces sp. Lzd4kr]
MIGPQIAGSAHIGQSLPDCAQSVSRAAAPMATPCQRTTVAAAALRRLPRARRAHSPPATAAS